MWVGVLECSWWPRWKADGGLRRWWWLFFVRGGWSWFRRLLWGRSVGRRAVVCWVGVEIREGRGCLPGSPAGGGIVRGRVQLQPQSCVLAGRCGRATCPLALKLMRRRVVCRFRIRRGSTVPVRGRGGWVGWLGGTLIINLSRRKSLGRLRGIYYMLWMDYLYLFVSMFNGATEFLGCKYILFRLLLLYSIDKRTLPICAALTRTTPPHTPTHPPPNRHQQGAACRSYPPRTITSSYRQSHPQPPSPLALSSACPSLQTSPSSPTTTSNLCSVRNRRSV